MFRSKVRTSLTIIAIVIGAMTITLTNGIGTGVKSYINEQIGNLGATNVLIVQLTDKTASPTSGPAKYTPSTNTSVASSEGRLGREQLMMTTQDLTTIKSVPNITNVVPAHSPSPDYIVGVGDKYQVALAQQFGSATAAMVAGKGVDNTSTQNQISVPTSYVSPLGYSSNQAIIGRTVTIGITSAEGTQSTVTAIVTGVQQKNLLGETTTYANTALATQLNNIQNTGIPAALANTFATAYATFPSNLTTSQINTIKSDLTKKGYTGKTIKDEEDTIFSVINVIVIVFDFFGIIALIAASFGIINTLFMTVQERTKEIGLMKALGMSPGKIFALFSIEAVLIGFWGSLIGVGLAMFIGRIVNGIGAHSFLKNTPGLSLLTFPLGTIITVIVGIMVIAFLAGTLPALRASRKDPIEALRYE
jgi:putative ABC transport system permease protein